MAAPAVCSAHFALRTEPGNADQLPKVGPLTQRKGRLNDEFSLAQRKMGGGADSPKASPKAASPRGEGKVAGVGELAQEEEAQAQDRLAVATKMGAEREALSAARDVSKAQAKMAALQQQLEAKEKAMVLQKDKMSKQELTLFKLGKEHEREQSEQRLHLAAAEVGTSLIAGEAGARGAGRWREYGGADAGR